MWPDPRQNIYIYDWYVKGAKGKGRQHARLDGYFSRGGNAKKESIKFQEIKYTVTGI